MLKLLSTCCPDVFDLLFPHIFRKFGPKFQPTCDQHFPTIRAGPQRSHVHTYIYIYIYKYIYYIYTYIYIYMAISILFDIYRIYNKPFLRGSINIQKFSGNFILRPKRAPYRGPIWGPYIGARYRDPT